MVNDRVKNERLEIKYGQHGFNIDESLERLKQAGSIKETALVVTHDALPLLGTILGNSIRRIVREELTNGYREFGAGMLEALGGIKDEQAMPTGRNTWTEAEDDAILSTVETLTSNGIIVKEALEQIALEGRSASAIRNRYYALKRRMADADNHTDS